MTRHPFDPVALVFGLAFAAAGVIVVTGGELIDEGRVLVPLGLVALGVGLLFRPARPAPTQPAPTVPFGYTETADRGTGVAPPADPTGPGAWPATPTDHPTSPTPADPTEPDRSGPTDAPMPGAEFYLGRDWRAPADEPDDGEPGR